MGFWRTLLGVRATGSSWPPGGRRMGRSTLTTAAAHGARGRTRTRCEGGGDRREDTADHSVRRLCLREPRAPSACRPARTVVPGSRGGSGFPQAVSAFCGDLSPLKVHEGRVYNPKCRPVSRDTPAQTRGAHLKLGRVPLPRHAPDFRGDCRGAARDLQPSPLFARSRQDGHLQGRLKGS